MLPRESFDVVGGVTCPGGIFVGVLEICGAE